LDAFLGEHRCAFEVVLVGTSAATVEAIMPGSNQERVMASIHRLRSHCSEVGTRLSIVFPLMRENWPEVGDVLLLADQWEVDVAVRHVTAPRASSLAALPATFRQEEVVRSLRRREQTLLPRLSRNRHVWDAVLASLDDTDESAQISAPEAPPQPLAAMGLARGFPERWSSSIGATFSPMDPGEARALVAGWTDGPILSIDADADDVVRSVSVDGTGFLGVDDGLVDQPFPRLVARLNEHQGEEATSVTYHVETTWCAWSVLYAALDRTVHVRALTLPVYRSGRLTGSFTVAGLRHSGTAREQPNAPERHDEVGHARRHSQG
ncbi:MAG: hypothetical protein KDB35_23575, partial [Acidimicrobiales bacterium]|nr:hypothetical protein [Acidimicrobiales bacterium]